MELDKDRKKLKTIAILSFFLGIVGLAASIWYGFILSGSSEIFSHLTNDEHTQAAITWLLTAVKVLGFGVIPCFSIVTTIVGWSILSFFRKENELK
jgi:hypothetical protein